MTKGLDTKRGGESGPLISPRSGLVILDVYTSPLSGPLVCKLNQPPVPSAQAEARTKDLRVSGG